MNLAVALIAQAADEGYIKAQSRLGLMYVEGNGVESNSELAFQYFNSSAEAGDPEGLIGLGMC